MEAKIYRKINASKWGIIKAILKYRKKEIITQIKSEKKAIFLDLLTPKNKGMVTTYCVS